MPTAKPGPLPVEQGKGAPRPLAKRIATGQFAVVYDAETVWPKIIETIAGGRSLASALREPGMPSYAQAKRTLRDNAELRDLYEQAKLDRAEAMGDALTDLADQTMPAYLEGAERGAWVQHLRVQIDTRKWLMARLHAKAFGDHVSVSVDQRISITDALAAANRRLEDVQREEIDITPPDTTDTPQDGF